MRIVNATTATYWKTRDVSSFIGFEKIAGLQKARNDNDMSKYKPALTRQKKPRKLSTKQSLERGKYEEK